MKNLKIENESGLLHIYFETENLLIRSITMEDEKDHSALMSNPINMKTFMDGKPVSPEVSKAALARRVAAWKNQNPYNLYAIFEKIKNKYVGFVCFTPSLSSQGTINVEVACIIDHIFQGKGYGREVTKALFEFVPELVQRNYKVDGKPVHAFKATVLTDNEPSRRMIARAGFEKQTGETLIHGNLRDSFFLSADQLSKKPQSSLVCSPNVGEEKSFTSQSKL